MLNREGALDMFWVMSYEAHSSFPQCYASRHVKVAQAWQVRQEPEEANSDMLGQGWDSGQNKASGIFKQRVLQSCGKITGTKTYFLPEVTMLTSCQLHSPVNII